MTVFAQHPEAIIQLGLLHGPRLLTGKLWYTVTTKEHLLFIVFT